MQMTLDQLKRQMSSIEIDASTYGGIGPEHVPLLDQLVSDPEAWLAGRAIHALSRIATPTAIAILARSAADPRPEVRVAVANAVRNLPPREGERILLQGLNDSELGVRKFAIRSVTRAHGGRVHERLRELEAADPAPALRVAARSKLAEVRREP